MILTALARLTLFPLPTPKFNKTLSFFFFKREQETRAIFLLFLSSLLPLDKGTECDRLTPPSGRCCFPLFVSKDLELCGGKSLLCFVLKGVHILVKVVNFVVYILSQ